ncbi:MAG: sodium:proton antiporter [Planctomycetota bacterium]|nr:sodium:proton antiporter [Planctomycetota bacterium]
MRNCLLILPALAALTCGVAGAADPGPGRTVDKSQVGPDRHGGATEAIFLGVAGIIVLGAAAQWLAWRLGLPSILLLLVFGIVAGPVLGWIDPETLFGDLLVPVVSLSVALILYEGGLTLRLSEFRKVGNVVRNLVTVGALATWVVSALAAHWILGFDPGVSALLGAVLMVTGPTVIGPLLRQIRPTGAVGPILKWEGIVIDPIGALFAVLIFEVLTGGIQETASFMLLGILKTIVFGGGMGLVSAGLLVLMLQRFWIPDFLENTVSLMLMVAAFAAANLLQHESGLLAVTVMGFVLANQKRVAIEGIVAFKENLRVLLISGLFIVLAARLELGAITGVAAKGLAFVAVLVFVARPLCVFVSTWRSNLPDGQRRFLACMGPRGIVAAAVASVFAMRLEASLREEIRVCGIAGAPVPGEVLARLESVEQLVPITFITIIATVALYGLTARPVSRRLGVAESNPQGILFAGAQGWVREIAALLHRLEYRVLLVDSNREHVHAARMEGLATYAGSVLSEQTLEDLDLGGIGRVLAVTPNNGVNVLAVNHFDQVFERSDCYQLSPDVDSPEKKKGHHHLHGRRLFNENATYSVLERLFMDGFKAKATRITDEFHFEDYLEEYKSGVPLFVIEEGGRLNVITAGETLNPKSGQTLISFVKKTDPLANADSGAPHPDK